MIAGQLFQLVFFIIFASVIVNAIFPNSEIILASRIYQACFALGVVVAYGSVTLQALRKRTPEAGDFLMTGITIAFFATVCQATYSIVHRLSNSPRWLMDADLIGVWINLSTMAAILHLRMPAASPAGQRYVRRILIASTVMGSLLVLLVLGLRPDLSGPVEHLRPLFEWFRSTSLPSWMSLA